MQEFIPPKPLSPCAHPSGEAIAHDRLVMGEDAFNSAFPLPHHAVHVRVSGNRRVGKTTVAACITTILQAAGHTVVWVPEHDTLYQRKDQAKMLKQVREQNMQPRTILLTEHTRTPDMQVRACAAQLLKQLAEVMALIPKNDPKLEYFWQDAAYLANALRAADAEDANHFNKLRAR